MSKTSAEHTKKTTDKHIDIAEEVWAEVNFIEQQIGAKLLLGKDEVWTIIKPHLERAGYDPEKQKDAWIKKIRAASHYVRDGVMDLVRKGGKTYYKFKNADEESTFGLTEHMISIINGVNDTNFDILRAEVVAGKTPEELINELGLEFAYQEILLTKMFVWGRVMKENKKLLIGEEDDEKVKENISGYKTLLTAFTDTEMEIQSKLGGEGYSEAQKLITSPISELIEGETINE